MKTIIEPFRIKCVEPLSYTTPAQRETLVQEADYNLFKLRAGSVMFGDAARQELLRLAIPRRVYTQSHVDYLIEAILEVNERKRDLHGYEIIQAPRFLRHFTARFRLAGSRDADPET